MRYANLLTTGKLNDYLADLNEQAEAMFSQLVKLLAEKEGITEVLKAESQMLWVRKMNNLRNALWKSFKRAYLPLEMTTIEKEHKCVYRKAGGCRLPFCLGEPKKTHRPFYPNKRR